MRRQFYFLLLAFLVLGIFYPSIFAESLSTDDQEMILAYSNMTALDWRSLFWPSAPPYYYRPVLGLSFYWWDHFFFDNYASFAHLTNILVHLANTLLLFLALADFKRKENPSNRQFFIPLLLAAFFGLHPLTAEPVNWISGRTDLLAGFFALLSFWVFRQNGNKKPRYDYLAAFLFLCGLWSKEVALGLLPVIFFACLQEEHFALRKNWRPIAGRLFPFFAATLLYSLMRTSGTFTYDIGTMTAIHGGHGAEHFALSAKFLSLIKAIGFYSQKIIWPFPLNFAIVEINRPLALALGIIAIFCLVVGVFFYRRRPVMLGIVWMFCFLAPALPVAVNRMAWTPLAERYLYLPLMGLCLTLVILMTETRLGQTLAVGTAIVLCGFAPTTVQRNIVWQKNMTLWKDVVEKSPNFVPGHNDYALALLKEGRGQEAMEHFAIAERLAEGTGKNLVKSNAALMGKNVEQQLAVLDEIQQNEKSPKLRCQVLYKMIHLLNDELRNTELTSEKQREWTKKMLTCQKQLAELDKNPYHLYRIGQLHLALGNQKAAWQSFNTVCNNSNDYFTQPACTLAKRLAKEGTKEKQ